MKVRSILTDQIFEAEWRTAVPASSYGQRVLVLVETGEAVDDVWYEILDEDELIGEC
ncbi:MAG: hypothetical protein WBC70_14575 [Candidatus Aminicenantales bacterium]